MLPLSNSNENDFNDPLSTAFTPINFLAHHSQSESMELESQEIELGSGDEENDFSIFYGALVVLIGAFCFGTLHVPVRRYAHGSDSVFLQWTMSFGSLFIGFVAHIVMGFPPFQPLATGGGMLWTVANSLAQFVIAELGLAPALLLWSTTNIMTGWSAGRFGLFGMKQKLPEHNLLNIIGLITVISGSFCFVFIRRSLPSVKKLTHHVFPRSRGSFRSSSMLFVTAEYEGRQRNVQPDVEEDNRGDSVDGEQILPHQEQQHQNHSNYPQQNSEQREEEKQQRRRRASSCKECSKTAILKRAASLEHSPNSSTQSNVVQEREQRKCSHPGCSTSSTFNSSSSILSIFSLFIKALNLLPERVQELALRHSKRLLCTFLALISGFFYCVTVVPIIYIQDNTQRFPGAPKEGVSYVLSLYIGTFLGSSCIFAGFALIKGYRPVVNNRGILLSFLGGAIWGCGMLCLLLANDLLTPTITYPVLITIPGLVASLWSIFYFREIQLDRRNSIIILLAFMLIFSGAVMVFLSKCKFGMSDLLPPQTF